MENKKSSLDILKDVVNNPEILKPNAEQVTKMNQLKLMGWQPDFDLSMNYNGVAFVVVSPDQKTAVVFEKGSWEELPMEAIKDRLDNVWEKYKQALDDIQGGNNFFEAPNDLNFDEQAEGVRRGPTSEQLAKMRELVELGYKPNFELSMANPDIAFTLVDPTGEKAVVLTPPNGIEETTVAALRATKYDAKLLAEMKAMYQDPATR